MSGIGKISRRVRNAKLGAFLSLTVAFILLSSCSPKIIPGSNTDTNVVVRDSIVFVKDTVQVPLPVEVIKEVVPFMDTLFMETSLATSKSYVDTTTKTLRGEIKNKQKSLPVEVQHQEEYHQRDSIQIKEVPVPYEVVKEKIPKLFWWLLGWFVLTLLGGILFIYFKIKHIGKLGV